MFSQLMPGWMVFSDVQASAPAPTASRAVSSSGRPRIMQAASAAAVARVERYYTDTLMFDRYRRVYEGALAPAAKG